MTELLVNCVRETMRDYLNLIDLGLKNKHARRYDMVVALKIFSNSWFYITKL